jgi:hypothetical protein
MLRAGSVTELTIKSLGILKPVTEQPTNGTPINGIIVSKLIVLLLTTSNVVACIIVDVIPN